jgi:hypothetical protein
MKNFDGEDYLSVVASLSGIYGLERDYFMELLAIFLNINSKRLDNIQSFFYEMISFLNEIGFKYSEYDLVFDYSI